ncbi:9698_t:CDS:2, partial [Racocetra fulgida]
NGKEAIPEVRLSIDNSVSVVDLSNSVVDQQNNADTKSMEGVPKVSDKEIDDFIPEELIPKPPATPPTSSEEESSTFEASNVHNSPRIEKDKQNEMSVEHSANVVSDNSNERTKIPYNQKVEQGLRKMGISSLMIPN